MCARFLLFSGYFDIRHPFQNYVLSLNGRSEHKPLFNEKVLKNRMVKHYQNLTKIEQNPRFKTSVLCTKFVENPSWRKGFFQFLWLLLFSPNSYFHNEQLFGFLD